MRGLSLFSGIGGLDKGFDDAGIKPQAFVEIEPLFRAILARHWPGIPQHDDIKTFSQWWEYKGKDLGEIDVVYGGFPCPPVSIAGLRKGTEDERWLWPEFHAAVNTARPRYVVIENVAALRTAKDAAGERGGIFRSIIGDLAGSGYDAIWAVVSAASLGFPYKRDRLFVVAMSHGILGNARDFKPEEAWREVEPLQNVAEAAGQALASFDFDGREADGSTGRMAVANGGPARMVEAAGNAVVPQMAEAVAQIVLAIEARQPAKLPIGSTP